MNLEETERNPTDVTLDKTAKDLLSFFNGFEHLHEVKRTIEKKFDIKKEHKHTCWPEDDIKRAWEETKKMDIKPSIRKDWAYIIILQVVNSFVCDTCKQNPNERGCKTRPNPEDRSSESNAEPERQGPAGGAQQSSGGHHQTPSHLLQTVNDFLPETQATGICSGAPCSQSFYIRIPLSKLAEDEPTDSNEVPNVSFPYRLIDGFPSGNSDLIRKRKSYVMSFDNSTNNAQWVYEILNKKTVDSNNLQGTFGHGYDRGHLAAAANHTWCQEAFNDTYLHSNIIPQDHSLNIGNWKKLEKRCRSMLKNTLIRNVHVYTGPLYLQPMNFPKLGGKAVPSHLFKVIIAENKDRTVREPVCYLMPNDGTTGDLKKYEKPIEYIQRISGLVFLERRPILRETDTIIRLNEEDPNQTQQHADIEVCISV
ncbi:nuclease [Carassius gibelio]|uniref:nuclease n=1 Tax=Carassius gibelio TaxID=101364 RepID=UPI002279BB40|nr:nuclease [Carassius gibelio]XP_052393510.1 nuclease [Carassius gibelio]